MTMVNSGLKGLIPSAIALQNYIIHFTVGRFVPPHTRNLFQRSKTQSNNIIVPHLLLDALSQEILYEILSNPEVQDVLIEALVNCCAASLLSIEMGELEEDEDDDEMEGWLIAVIVVSVFFAFTIIMAGIFAIVFYKYAFFSYDHNCT